MKKSTFIKRIVALLLVVLMSIDAFAAVVGDNDGAAFITKAEFDSMKNDFQSQLDRYNSSIDNKIDGAIAGYLAGISVAKQYEINPLVSNYKDMYWVNKYQIYGKWRKWTSETSKTENTTNNWYVPELNEKRALTRKGNNWTLYDPLYGADGYGIIALDLQFVEYKNGFSLGKRNNGSGDTSSSVPPVAHVRLAYNASERQYYPETSAPLGQAFVLMNVQHFIPRQIWGGGNWYLSRAYPLYFDYAQDPPLVMSTPTGSQVYHMKFYWGMRWNGGYTQSSESVPQFSEFLYPNFWTNRDFFGGGDYDNEFDRNTVGQLNGEGTTDSTYYARGVTYNQGDTATGAVQKTYFLRMMLGKSSTQKVNAGYISTKGGSQTYDFSSTDDTGQIKVRLASAQLSQPLRIDKSMDGERANESYVPTTDIEFTLNLPLWPTLKMQDINSNYFRYENQPLKKGAGLPIAKNIVANGDLHISAKYETARIVSTYSSKGISVDVANDTFTTDDWKYLDGFEGNVDSGKTTTPIKVLKDIKFNNTEKKLELTIPVKKEDNVWLRIAPDTTDGGYYAKLSDLKVTLESY